MMDNQQTGRPATVVSGLPFSEAVRAGQLLFISGQVGVGEAGPGQPGAEQTGAEQPGAGQPGAEQTAGAGQSFEAEVRQTMTNLAKVLERQGLGFGDLVQVTIYLVDIGNYAETNRVYSGYFRDRFPARVCLAVKELPVKARVEISAIAQFPSN